MRRRSAVTVVPFGQHEFTQVYGHAAQRVVNHCNHVLDLRFGERRLPLTVAYLTYLVFARLDLPVEQRHALAGVGGKLHARMLDLHDDRVRLRARQRAGVILKPRQRLDRTMARAVRRYRNRCDAASCELASHA